jgi:AraC family transcriptional regulator
MEQWADEHDVRFAGAPWESYVTDPAANPDQSTWRTEIFWPLRA